MNTASHTANLAGSFKTWSVSHSKAKASLPGETPRDTRADTGSSGSNEPPVAASGTACA
jgi:hypothetical protein